MDGCKCQYKPCCYTPHFCSIKKAGIIEGRSGTGGAKLAKDPDELTLLDFYQAVQVVADNELFHIHSEPNPNCYVGANIQGVLEVMLGKAQRAMEEVLASMTLADVLASFPEKSIRIFSVLNVPISITKIKKERLIV